MCKAIEHSGYKCRKDMLEDKIKSGFKIDLWCMCKADRRSLKKIQAEMTDICISRGSNRCNGCKYDGYCSTIDDLVDDLRKVEFCEL